MAPARIAAGATLAVVALGLAGCGAPANPGVSASTASVGSGAYPNLNVPLVPATAQLTPEQRTATADELQERKEALAPSESPSSTADDLRRIGSAHSQDAIRRIEGG